MVTGVFLSFFGWLAFAMIVLFSGLTIWPAMAWGVAAWFFLGFVVLLYCIISDAR